jgi:hypothetical protein
MWGRKCKSGAHARCLVTLEGHADGRAVAVGDKQQVMIGDARTFPAANSDIIDEVQCGVAACSISVPGAEWWLWLG